VEEIGLPFHKTDESLILWEIQAAQKFFKLEEILKKDRHEKNERQTSIVTFG
jgi:hypothetical protein